MSKKANRKISMAALIICIGLGALALTVAKPYVLSGKGEKKAPPARPAAPQSDKPRAGEPVHNIRFTLYDAGILPREIHVDEGLVAIAIEDRTRKSEGLVVEREVGRTRQAVGQVKRIGEAIRGRTELKLTPGIYSVFDSSLPGNRARLFVEP